MARTCCQRLSTFKVMSLVNHLFAFFCYVIYLNPQYTLSQQQKQKFFFLFTLLVRVFCDAAKVPHTHQIPLLCKYKTYDIKKFSQ